MPSSADLGAVDELAAAHRGVVTRRRAARLEMRAQVVARLVARRVLDEPVPGVLVVRGSPTIGTPKQVCRFVEQTVVR